MQFINAATGNNGGVGHNLQSCTTEISATKLQFFERSLFDVVFVDTPGFDDTNKTDGEILELIADWLNKTYELSLMVSLGLTFYTAMNVKLPWLV
jgi:predicted GTPase